jgi:ADP-glucose pyrophosphorylase
MINDQVLGIILGGGQGSRLYPLTETRSKPAVPIAGKYRLVDIPISNCIHSEIKRMFVLTQFNSASLNILRIRITLVSLVRLLSMYLLPNKQCLAQSGFKEQQML